MNTQQLIHEAVSLPEEERAVMVDALLSNLDLPEPEMDREWAAVALNRLGEIRSGKVKPVPGEQVFEKIWKRFDK
uniref:Putative addiction module component, TIGR02574 family n=1 Tax=Candidatus Kentrum sp. DK TaxID=2126562 RepID=A0A450RX29_9GAMM|nr:MAG: putative addiction module component, TIGR02574 family [Candidatus Kentron sp. DK]